MWCVPVVQSIRHVINAITHYTYYYNYYPTSKNENSKEGEKQLQKHEFINQKEEW